MITFPIDILAPKHYIMPNTTDRDDRYDGNETLRCRRRRRSRPMTTTRLTGIVVVLIYFSSTYVMTIHSSSSSPTSLTHHRRRKQKRQKTTSLSSSSSSSSSHTVRNPFSKDRTIVSGFGSRSIRKTIFSRQIKKYPSSRKGKEKNRKKKENKEVIETIIEEDVDSNDEGEDEEFLATVESPKMWVQRSKYVDDENIASNALWVLIGDEKCNNNEKKHKAKNNGVVLKLTFDDETDDWVTKKATKKEKSEFIQSHPLDEWVPIEGLYGIYKVPSGFLWILITGTEPIYEAPPLILPSTSTQTSSWWKVRRVTNLEIVHLGNKGYQINEMTTSVASATTTFATTASEFLSAPRLREEVRQLKLFRKALKQHDFYYTSRNSDSSVVWDMTRTIQRSILDANRATLTSSLNKNGAVNHNNKAWWKPCIKGDDYNTASRFPDPRFFWNQHAVEPILKRFHENDTRYYSSLNNEKIIDNNRYDHQWQQQRHVLADILLQHVIPLTSAFVGVQTNISVNSGVVRDDDDNSYSSSSGSGNDNGNNSKTITSSYDEILISRRSRFRAGTRFTVRGADATGDCANFVETEQICLTTTMPKEVDSDAESSNIAKKAAKGDHRYLQSVASHVQVRGSIPLRWSSPADVKTYRPRVHIGTDPLAQARAVRLHILDQLAHYTLSHNHYGKNKLVNYNNLVKGGRSSNVADIVFVNLVDKKSDQGRLGRAFDAVLKAVVDVHGSGSSSNDKPTEDYLTETTESNDKATIPSSSLDDQIGPNSVNHVWYDFHAEVKHGRWDRLGLLLEEVQPSLTSHGYFLSHVPSMDIHQQEGNSKVNEKEDFQWSVQRLQNAVVRTNCMDCLDRTNVVQSIFGRYMLFQQLSGEPDGSSNENEPWANLNKKFRKKSLKLPWEKGEVAHCLLWADNADAISRLYAGTPALKGDFTRTGQRTKRGALDDGMNSLQRYYLNNFLDADRQEGYDLMVGHAAFSNCIGEFPVNLGAGTKVNPLTHHTSSLSGGTRETILSIAIRGSAYQDREDLRNRLEDSRISKQIPGTPSDHFPPALDLRWLPGDLQAQVRNQANEKVSHRDNNSGDEADTRTKSKTKREKGGFNSQEALKAIDERSVAENPWWTKSVGNWLVINKDDGQDTSRSIVAESSQHRSQVILTPIQLATVLLLGLRAPIMLGSLAVVILSFVYLPECIKHDIEEIFSFAKSLF